MPFWTYSWQQMSQSCCIHLAESITKQLRASGEVTMLDVAVTCTKLLITNDSVGCYSYREARQNMTFERKST